MAYIPPLCALLVGYSFVRMTEFITLNQQGGLYTHTFGLVSTCSVKTIRIGGRPVDKLIKFDLQAIQVPPPMSCDSWHGFEWFMRWASSPGHGRIVDHRTSCDSVKGFETPMFSFVPSFALEIPAISKIQRKGLALKWFTPGFTKGSRQRHSWGKVLDSPWLM